MLRRLAGTAVTIETRLEGCARIKVDPGQLEQVLFNLVFNSRDAMPHGGHLLIEIGERRGSSKTPMVFVRVTDDGEGMDAQTLARCQEPFFTTKSRSRGIGLGLATVASILERSGGTLEMTSEVGRGTSSIVLFPSVDVPEGPRDSDLEAKHRRVLLVDDDDQVRVFAARVLSQSGYVVTEVPDGESAIRLIEGKRSVRSAHHGRGAAGHERSRRRAYRARSLAGDGLPTDHGLRRSALLGLRDRRHDAGTEAVHPGGACTGIRRGAPGRASIGRLSRSGTAGQGSNR